LATDPATESVCSAATPTHPWIAVVVGVGANDNI
jgi:hypothetical protein